MSGSQAGTMLASSQATGERGGKGENQGRREEQEKKDDGAGGKRPTWSTLSSPSRTLKPPEERGLSCGFSPPEDLTLRGLPGGRGGRGPWEGRGRGVPSFLLSPRTLGVAVHALALRQAARRGDLTLLSVFLRLAPWLASGSSPDDGTITGKFR